MRNKKIIFFNAVIVLILSNSLSLSNENNAISMAKQLILDKKDCDKAWNILWNLASSGSNEAFLELGNGFLNGLMPPNHKNIGRNINEYFDYLYIYGYKVRVKVNNRIIRQNINDEMRLVIERLSIGHHKRICKNQLENAPSIDTCVRLLIKSKHLLSRNQFIKTFNAHFSAREKAECISTIPGL